MSEAPQTVHGRLLEAVHIFGYTFERACSELEWLLEEDRWKLVGFDDIHAFIASLDFAEFKMVAEQRQKIARRLTAIDAKQREIAKLLGVSKTTVVRDLADGPKGPPANAKAPDAKGAGVPVGPKGPDAAEWFEGDPKTTAKAAKGKAAQGGKKAKRDEREQALGERIRSEAERLGDMAKIYGVILADPSWRWEPWSDETGMDRAADNHYPTSPTAALMELVPPAADAAVLLLWATAPMLLDALRVMAAWGFEYKSCLCWDKVDMSHGYWFRGQHELLLVGTRGDFPAPAQGTQLRSVLTEKATDHSVKPTAIADWIDEIFPSLPKLEMFARTGRPGWDSWGAEAPESEAA